MGSAAPVLYLVACAAPPVRQISDLVVAAKARGWDTCLVLTPTAARWLETSLTELAAITGHPVRSEYKLPDQPDVLPPADAMLVAPVTSNSINKWAAGISDTLALGLITEAVGKRLPLAAVPSLNRDQAAHPAFAVSMERLRAAGVRTVLDDDGHALRKSGTVQSFTYPWHLALDSLDDVLPERRLPMPPSHDKL